MTAVTKSLRSLAARVTMGEKDVRALLTKDHVEALALAKRITESKSSSARKSLLTRLKPALAAHSHAEEKQVYDPLIKLKDKDSNSIGHEGYVEHHLLEELLDDLQKGDSSTQRWQAQAKVLHELLKHHIEEEHSEMYADLGKNFDSAELEAMGVKFLAAKQKLLPKKK